MVCGWAPHISTLAGKGLKTETYDFVASGLISHVVIYVGTFSSHGFVWRLCSISSVLSRLLHGTHLHGTEIALTADDFQPSSGGVGVGSWMKGTRVGEGRVY
jgi:hypothetical protein